MPGFMGQDEKALRIAAAATAGDAVHGGGRDVHYSSTQAAA